MTIIAYKDNTIIADKAEWYNDIKTHDDTNKIVEADVGSLKVYIACAGYRPNIERSVQLVLHVVRKYYDAKHNSFTVEWDSETADKWREINPTKEVLDGLLLIIDSRTYDAVPRVFHIGNDPWFYEVKPPVVFGNPQASSLALAAIKAGAELKQAVQVAIAMTGIADPNKLDIINV